MSDTEVQEFSDFGPTIVPEGTWDLPESMTAFLSKHFNRCLSDIKREAILSDFPRPNSSTLYTPKLDDLVKDQLLKKGKNPQFGSERTLCKLQQQLLEVLGPLACLWSDMINPEASHQQRILSYCCSEPWSCWAASHMQFLWRGDKLLVQESTLS